MRLNLSILAVCLLLPLSADAQNNKYYTWKDKDGNIHYGDSIPPQYAEQPKQVLNDQGVIVEHLEGKKTEEQLLAERRAAELEAELELQRRADEALLATYGNVDEIVMHRDRRVELYQAQARVTELYLRNAQRRLNSLERDAKRYKPYSSDPNAATIDAGLLDDIEETKDTIRRQEENLGKYKASQEQIIARFEGDITRFKTLKGLD